MSPLLSIPEALEDLRAGKFLIVVDDENRENEGDLIVAAEYVTEEQMAFLIRQTSGIVFLAISHGIADQLDLPMMVEHNTARRGTPFTVSIEAAQNVTTGVSAADRVTTVRAAIAPDARPEDLARPGHIFPLRAHKSGVLKRTGHTEASVDLMRLAGLRETAVGAELMKENGTMMRMPDLEIFGKEHTIGIITIEDLIAFRRRSETCIRKETEADLETETGAWRMHVYTDGTEPKEHVALVKGEIDPLHPVLVRVHSECLTGDILGSLHCDCGGQLHAAMRQIEKEGNGILLYMRQEGRGIGLINKIKAYDLQNREKLDTVEANHALGLPDDLRDYGAGAQILKDLGVNKIRLLTNNPRKVVGLQGFGLEVIERVPLKITPRSERESAYVKTKEEKMGHVL